SIGTPGTSLAICPAKGRSRYSEYGGGGRAAQTSGHRSGNTGGTAAQKIAGISRRLPKSNANPAGRYGAAPLVGRQAEECKSRRSRRMKTFVVMVTVI